MRTATRQLIHASVAAIACLISAGCSNSFMSSLNTAAKNASSLTTTGTSTTSTAQSKLVISNVSISAGNGSGSSSFSTNIFLDTTKSTAPISSYCTSSTQQSSQTSKPCICQFSWNEINPYSSSSAPIARTVQTKVTTIQPNLAVCSAPDVYAEEIPNGTKISIAVLGAANNSDSGNFTVSSYTYTKNTTATTGSFQDAQGQIFDNVLHYSCFQKLLRGMSIQSKLFTRTSPAGSVFTSVYGTQFCLSRSSTSTGGNSQDCPNLSPPDYSSQSYYYNFFIRNSERGDINQFNDGYICPMVEEALNHNGTLGTKNQPWPLDSTFALSLGPTTTFKVGVEANTKLASGNDPTAANSSCYSAATNSGTTPSTTSTASSSGFINSCLGFAAAVNSDGTCPYFKDSKGQIRATYRLRRYVALYPRLFDTNGAPLQGAPQGVDTVYVLDRPVKGPANSDPLKPYTMRGPKPCPFAFFDKKGATNGVDKVARYVATNSSSWKGVNVDAIEFPNQDSGSASNSQSCSTTFPILDSTGSKFQMMTVNKNNAAGLKHMFVRPIQPFIPHYEEDTSFQACAPQASQFVDPPLHFARDTETGNIAWCSESYPTQNPSVQGMDGTGQPPYTSHSVLNSQSATCTSTEKSNYSTHASGTCDRTVAPTSGITWSGYPLLAPAAKVTEALQIDKSYQCTLTYDNNGSKTGKYSPADGCCDINSVNRLTGNGSAHLEPDVPCRIPNY